MKSHNMPAEPATEPSSADELTEVVYSSKSPLRHPFRLIREILVDIWKFRQLTGVLFLRDLKAQYRQSYLGYFWMVTPLISTAVVWTFLAESKAIQVAETPIPYPLYVMLGSLIWGTFTGAVNQPAAGFGAGSSVLMKLKVPPEAFMISGLASQLFQVVLRMLVLIPVFVVLGVSPAASAWLFPIGLLCAIVCGLSIGMLLLPISALYQDISKALGIALSLMMYATPVVYPPPKEGWGADLINANPLSALVVTTRDWLTLGYEGDWSTVLVMTACASVLLMAGMAVFRTVLPRLIERLGM